MIFWTEDYGDSAADALKVHVHKLPIVSFNLLVVHR